MGLLCGSSFERLGREVSILWFSCEYTGRIYLCHHDVYKYVPSSFQDLTAIVLASDIEGWQFGCLHVLLEMAAGPGIEVGIWVLRNDTGCRGPNGATIRLGDYVHTVYGHYLRKVKIQVNSESSRHT
jgi:hypothetical protein